MRSETVNSAGGRSTRARFAARRSARATSRSAADGARARRPHAATAGMGTHLRMTGRNAAAEECVAKLCTANMSTERRVRRGARAE